MKLAKVLAFATLPTSSFGWKRFSLSESAPSVIDDVRLSSQSPIELNPTRLLESSHQKPEFYAAAMLEIKRLEEKPICHRMAAQLLVKNCQGMKDLRMHEYQVASDGMQRHHIESFAASLAMCDMDRARFDIPEACRPFRSQALEIAIRGTGNLGVSSDDVSLCLEGLGQDHSHWSTWLSYRDTSLLLCRGASVDVGKDQAIKFQRKFVQMMEEFTAGLYDDMLHLRKQMADYSRDSKLYFEEAQTQAETWKEKVHESYQTVSEDLQSISSAIKSILAGTNDASRMMRNFVSTMVQSNAEAAYEQERAVSIATNNLKSSFGGINILAMDNEAKLGQLHEAIVGPAFIGVSSFAELLQMQMTTAVGVLIERQHTIERSSQNTLVALINATELVQSHEQKLHQASVKAFKISEDLDKVATNAAKLNSWALGLDWVTRTVVPVITLFGGNFKTDATTTNNLLLLSIGYFVGESINIARHWDKSLNWAWYSEWFNHFSLNTEDVQLPYTDDNTYKGRITKQKFTPSPSTPDDSENSKEQIEMV